MSDEEDDYLSDKFLATATASTSTQKTYSDLRKDAQKKAFMKQEQNRQKSRRELELEAREEGLSKSLFERAKEEQEELGGGGSKALAMMMRMGYTVGQSLGKPADEAAARPRPESAEPEAPMPLQVAESTPVAVPTGGHKTEPLPLNEWEGRKGIGNRKRALSPTASERIAKMAKMAETSNQATFRDRAKQEYAERRAEGQLVSAQRTCVALDDKEGKTFNVLSLNVANPDSFPPGLMEAIERDSTITISPIPRDAASRLRQQMKSDALQPLNHDATEPVTADPEYTPDVIEEAAQFLRLQAQDRLELVLAYLRYQYTYCFWCGTKYENEEDMDLECPGAKEDDH